MAINVIDKYLSSKKKKIYSYCIKLNKIVGIKDKNIFINSTEFNDVLSFSVSYYVENLIFKNDFNYNDINSYYKYTNENSVSFNKAYFCLLKYYKDNNFFNTYSLKIFYLIILLGFAFEIDKNVETIKKNKEIYRNLINGYINAMNNEMLVLNKNYKKLVNEMINQICLNKSNEDMFFNTMKMDNAYNTYSLIDKSNIYLIVNFNYKNEGLDSFNKVDVSRLSKKTEIRNSYTFISYELSCIEMLRLFLNEKYGYKLIMKIDLSFCKKASNFKKLDAINKKSLIKDNILLMLSYEEISEDIKIINLIKSYGYNVVINYKNNEVDKNIDALALVNNTSLKGENIINKIEVIKEELL